MTLMQLERIYNFHDCDVFLPFEVDNDSITVTFDLAKHVQYEDFKQKHRDLVDDESYGLVVKIEFSQCSNVEAREWLYNGKQARLNEKAVGLQGFNREMFLYTVSMEEKDGVCCLFTANSSKGGEISFRCEEVKILEEKFIDAEEREQIWKSFENK